MRRQLPVYSPLTLSAVRGAAGAALTAGDTERDTLRSELSRRFDARTVILVDSGTNALRLALSTVTATDAGPVALPGYSCYDLVTAAVGAGAQVRFYDVDPRTLTPDLDSVREVLRQGVSALVAGNLYGYPLAWQELASIADAAGVPIVEDAAQGVGTETPAGPGGSLGAASILSFGRGKGWTGGGGGALLLRDPRLQLESEATGTASGAGGRSAGVTLAAWALGRPTLYRIPTSIPGLGLGETHYKEPSAPRDISTFSAALARRTSDLAREAVSRRREVAREILEAIEAIEAIEATGRYDSGEGDFKPCEPVGGVESASFLRLAVRAGGREAASDLLRRGTDLGVASGYPRPLCELDAAQGIMVDGTARELPGSRELAAHLVTLPTHEWLTARDRVRLAELFEPRR